MQVSGFPNMNAVALEDGTGQTFVGTLDFLKASLAVLVSVKSLYAVYLQNLGALNRSMGGPNLGLAGAQSLLGPPSSFL